MTCALVTACSLCSAALPARRPLLLLRPKQLIQKMMESICSLAAFPSSSSCSALVTLGLKSWHECRDALQSLNIFISMSIAVSVNISSTIFENTLKRVLDVSQNSLWNMDFTQLCAPGSYICWACGSSESHHLWSQSRNTLSADNLI